MVIVWALSWWYGAGWKARMVQLREQLAASYDYFSIGLLLRTLFSPYKQISAGRVTGPIGVKWRAFVDRLISRVIGAFVRILFVVVGSGWMLVQAAYGVVVLAAWAFLPLGPLIGFIAMVAGWTPSWV